jgi:FMN phosphatase YigB (HAD superfamily)
VTNRRHIIWDLDNTIYAYPDPKSPWLWGGLFEALVDRHAIDELSMDRMVEMAKQSYENYGNATQIFGEIYGLDARRLYHDWFDFLQTDAIEPCMETVRQFNRSRHRHGILTHAVTKWADRILNHYNIRQHFVDGAIIGIEQVDFAWKHESERPLCMALDRLGASASDAIMVEDHIRNLRPAKDLGLFTVLVTQDKKIDDNGHCTNDIPDHIDLVVPNAADLLKKLNRALP